VSFPGGRTIRLLVRKVSTSIVRQDPLADRMAARCILHTTLESKIEVRDAIMKTTLIAFSCAMTPLLWFTASALARSDQALLSKNDPGGPAAGAAEEDRQLGR